MNNIKRRTHCSGFRHERDDEGNPLPEGNIICGTNKTLLTESEAVKLHHYLREKHECDSSIVWQTTKDQATGKIKIIEIPFLQEGEDEPEDEISNFRFLDDIDIDL